MRWLFVLLAACSGTDKSSPPAKAEPPTVDVITLDAKHEVASEDVTLTAGKRSFGGTLTSPKTAGKFPGVLILAGSGPTDRDWNSALIPTKNGSAALLATDLTKHGAVVLRFDKAGSGKNPGPPLAEFTLDTYREEAVAALALLRTRADADRIYVIGHSEGGLHATRLAQIEKVAGVIYLSSLSRPEGETMLDQLEKQLRNPIAMLSDKAVEQEMEGLRKAFADFYAGKPVDPDKASRIPQLQLLVKQLINPATATLTRALLAFDTAAEAPKLAGPFFVFAGGKDVQIDLERDAKRLEKSLRDAKRDVTFHLSPDADHVLKHEPKSLDEIRANPVAAQNGYNAEGRVLDEDFVAALVAWLAKESSSPHPAR